MIYILIMYNMSWNDEFPTMNIITNLSFISHYKSQKNKLTWSDLQFIIIVKSEIRVYCSPKIFETMNCRFFTKEYLISYYLELDMASYLSRMQHMGKHDTRN